MKMSGQVKNAGRYFKNPPCMLLFIAIKILKHFGGFYTKFQTEHIKTGKRIEKNFLYLFI